MELNFSKLKIHKEKSQSSNSKLPAVLKMSCDFGEGGTMCPLALIGLSAIQELDKLETSHAKITSMRQKMAQLQPSKRSNVEQSVLTL